LHDEPTRCSAPGHSIGSQDRRKVTKETDEKEIDLNMKAKTLTACTLMALGIMAFVYQGMTYGTRETALDLGTLKMTVQGARTIPIPPIVGAVALLSGLALLVVRGSRATVPVIGVSRVTMPVI